MPRPHKPPHTKTHPKKALKPSGDFPPPEDELGGGDFCSPVESPSTDDDKPLD